MAIPAEIKSYLLLLELERAAAKVSDGHLAILKFTTNWRVGFCTPMDREDIACLPSGETFEEAANEALRRVAGT